MAHWPWWMWLAGFGALAVAAFTYGFGRGLAEALVRHWRLRREVRARRSR